MTIEVVKDKERPSKINIIVNDDQLTPREKNDVIHLIMDDITQMFIEFADKPLNRQCLSERSACLTEAYERKRAKLRPATNRGRKK